MAVIGERSYRELYQNRTTAQQESDLFMTSMITDRNGRHEVLIIKNYNFREKKSSEVMKEIEICI